MGYSLIGASSGAASAAANDGNILQGAVIGAFSGAAFSGVAGADYSSFGAYEGAARFGAFGAVGGITSVASGGKFGHGFLSAGIGSSVGSIPGLEGREFQDAFNRVLVGAVVGGTVSEITGGKFANGAAYGAFALIVREGVAASNSRPPDFQNMTNEEQVAWVRANADSLGIDLSNISEIDLSMSDVYVRDRMADGGWITCENATCGGVLDSPISGNFDLGTGTISLFKPAFMGGNQVITLPNSSFTNVFGEPGQIYRYLNYSRIESVIQTIGHEVSHSHGIDLIPGNQRTHLYSEKAGYDAVQRFRSKYR